MKATIFHNPKCGTSRKTLTLLENLSKVDVEVVEYLKDPPSREKLAQLFKDALPVSGIVLTKLDGTAKGGIIFAIAERLGVPIRFIGVGEGIENLREFNAGEFVEALFETGQ